MSVRIGSILLAGVLLSTAACRDSPRPEPSIPQGMQFLDLGEVGFERPLGVAHDAAADDYLVSNLGRAGAEGSGDAFISRVSPSGRVTALRWIDGRGGELREPRGMTLRGDTLFVADLDCVRRFNRRSGEPMGGICPPGATALVDLAFDGDGRLHVTDDGTRDGALFVVDTRGRVWREMEGEDLGGPRGVAASRRGVFVAGRSGQMYQVTPNGPRPVMRGRRWSLYDLVFTSDGSVVLSNPGDANVLYLRAQEGGAKGDLYTLVSDVPSSAGLAWDRRRGRVLIALPDEDRLLLVTLEG